MSVPTLCGVKARGLCRKEDNRNKDITEETSKRLEIDLKAFEDFISLANDGYDIVHFIGRGRYGKVYAGFRRRNYRPVAIKAVSNRDVEHWGKTDETTVPFEFVLLKKVGGHQGVISVYDWRKTRDHCLLIMERPIPVSDLSEYCKRSAPVPESTARKIFIQIAKAISYCHRKGVAHRDLKPANVLIDTETLQTKIIDFGRGVLLKKRLAINCFKTPKDCDRKCFERRQCLRLDIWGLAIILEAMVDSKSLPFSRAKFRNGRMQIERDDQNPRFYQDLMTWILEKSFEDRPSVAAILNHRSLREPYRPDLE